SPVGAGLAMLPLYLWFWTGLEFWRSPLLVAPWVAAMAVLMISSVATFSWSSMRLRTHIRFEAIAVVVLLGAALISAPWHTLTFLCVAYLATLPFSVVAYGRVKRLRAASGAVPRSPAPTVPEPEPGLH
ncbi:MAG: CDP-diacylglycerol O-phosphatidyltransferase, partial [Lysobacteraceae bacterium]